MTFNLQVEKIILRLIDEQKKKNNGADLIVW